MARAKNKFTLTQTFELFDAKIKERWLEERQKERVKSQEEYWERRQDERREWQQRYEEHLESDYWKKIRSLVLARDKEMCQGCLSNLAQHVHHLTYERMGRELAIDLVSLCVECHERAHKLPFVDLTRIIEPKRAEEDEHHDTEIPF